MTINQEHNVCALMPHNIIPAFKRLKKYCTSERGLTPTAYRRDYNKKPKLIEVQLTTGPTGCLTLIADNKHWELVDIGRVETNQPFDITVELGTLWGTQTYPGIFNLVNDERADLSISANHLIFKQPGYTSRVAILQHHTEPLTLESNPEIVTSE